MKTITGILGLDRERTLEEWKSLALNLADLLIQAGLKSSVNRAFGTDELEEFRRNISPRGRPRKDETEKRKRQVGRPLLWTPQVLSAVRKTIDEIKHNSVEAGALLHELEFMREFDGTEVLIRETEARLRSLQKPLTDRAAAQILIDRWAETNSLSKREARRKSYAQSICVALSKSRA